MKLHLLLPIVGVACHAPVPERAGTLELRVDGRAQTFAEARVASIDDANERWQLTMRTTPRLEEGSRILELRVDGETFCSTGSWGSSGDDSWLVFPLTTHAAAALASRLGVEAKARAPLTIDLSVRVETPADATAGAARQPLQIVLTNAGPEAVWFLDGGRSRNELGRDNRFTFAVRHGDTALPIRRVEDFGGIARYRRLGPGDAWTFAVDLAHWCTLDRPGAYSLRVDYEAELMPASFDPGVPLPLGGHAHLQRIRRLTAEAIVTVR